MDFLSRRSSAGEALARLGLDREVELLQTLARLQRHWPELRTGTTADSPLEYLVTLEDELDVQGPRLEALDIDPAALSALGAQLRRACADLIPASWRRLLRPLASFDDDPGLVQLPLLDAAVPAGTTLHTGAASLVLAGDGEARLELEAFDQPELGLPVSPAEDAGAATCPLRIGLAGQILGEAGAGGVAAVDGEARGRLDYWFRVPADMRFAPAAAACLERLPSPFSPDGILTANDFAGLQWQSNCHLEATLELEYSLLSSAGALVADAGIVLSASYRGQREFRLTAWPDGDRLALRLRRTRGSNMTDSAGLGIELDIADLAQQVRERLVVPNLRNYEGVYRRFGAFLKPGSLLQTRYLELLESLAARVATDSDLQTLLRLVGGAETDHEQLQQSVADRLVRWLDSGPGIFSRATGPVLAQQGAAAVAEVLPAGVPPQLRERIADEIHGLLEALQGKLADTVEAQAQDTATDLLGELAQLGGSIASAVDSAANRLDAALAGVRAALEKIDARIQALTANIEAVARRRIELRILAREQRQRRREAEIELRLAPDNDKARDLYRKLLSGDLEVLAGLLEKQPTSLAGVELVSGSASELLERRETKSTELALLGLSLGSLSIVDSRVQLEQDLAGNITIQSRLEVRRALDGIREQQSAGFLSLLNIRRGGRRSLPLNLAVTQQDERLELDELETFLDGLVGSGLLSPLAAGAAVQRYCQWQGQAGGGFINAQIEARLTIEDEALEALLDYADPQNSTDTGLLADVLQALQDFDVVSEKRLAIACRAVRQLDRRYRHYPDAEQLFTAFNAGPRSEDRPLSGRDDFFAAPFARCLDNPPVRSLDSRGLRDARRVHLFAKSWALILRKLHQHYHSDATVGDGGQIERDNQLLAFCLHRWLRVRQYFLFHPADSMSKQTMAFIGLLARAACIDGEPPLSIAMELEGEPESRRLYS
ncbi:hypothetical protein [Microbulbifer sediminum]|uniref:hypothetical protein n=1 Tax=Microbulbifer sediminum TaxID=2904250 RepID=UPI001F46C1F9|nr:hypothetical protein [Microbulbifer sediminum]